MPLKKFFSSLPFFIRLIGFFIFCFNSENIYAQEKVPDSVFFLAEKKGILGKIGKGLSVNNTDPLLPKEGAIKNELKFNPYRGKIIRNIRVQKIRFEGSVNDTSRRNKSLINDVGDALHVKTSNKTIFKNLFFASGDTLYPYLIADNERFLRELTYLQDARIVVEEIFPISDSVDIMIICKDVFPIGGSLDQATDKMVSFEVNDDNIAGYGDRIQIRNLFDAERNPRYGIGFEFLKRNLMGSFINLALGYQNIAPSFNTGKREEKALYIQGELPLVSPYHAWTGAFEIANHFTENVYWPDSIYRSDVKYNYQIFDGWIGHNIGARKQLEKNFKSRFKKLISLRFAHKTFLDVPELYKTQYNIGYSNLITVLSSFTIFEQDYYHTKFLYGFGRNEDIPEGFSLSFTGGWSNRNNVARPYVGFEYQRNYFTNNKSYLNFDIRFGTYYADQSFEDISALTGIEFFTRLRKMGNSLWYNRHFLSGSITQLLKTRLNDPLRLSSDYGIPQLTNPDLKASTRITLNAETVFYNTWKLVGFSFAPFAFANSSYLKTIGSALEKGDLYTAIGAGIRTRNENLVFGTMELKAYYYPKTSGTLTLNQWNVTFNTDLRYRYTSRLIKRPDFVIVN